MSEIMFADGLISKEELAHYGTPMHSGRYPWGSGENPYHHGASSPFGRLKKRREEKKAAKAKAERTRKTQEARAAKAEYEKNKAAALKSGSAAEISPYLKDLSYNEIVDLKKRLQLEAEFRKLAVDEMAAGDPKVALAIAKAERINKQANTAIDSYNTFAKVYNAFSSNGNLPIIGNKTRKDITFENAKNKELLEQKRAATKKLKEEAKKAKAERKSADLHYKEEKYDFDQRKKGDKGDSGSSSESEESSTSNAKKKSKPKNAKSWETRTESPSYDVYDYRSRYEPFVEEIRDVEVYERPVETRASRQISTNNYMLEDKKKKRK